MVLNIGITLGLVSYVRREDETADREGGVLEEIEGFWNMV
jgi:hypothetical protein